MKMQLLIDDVLSYEPPLRVYNSTGMATLKLKMRDEDTSMEDMKNADVAAEEVNTRDTNDTLTSNVLCKIYKEEVFNKADDLIEDSPSIPNATPGKKMRPRRRKGSSKFKPARKGRWKGSSTYQPKGNPRAAKVNAAVSISNSLHTDFKTDEDQETPPLSQEEERQLISLIYFCFGSPLPEE